MRRLSFKYLIYLLLVSLLPLDCQKQPEAAQESEGCRDGVWTKVHYRASVSSSAGTKATLDAIDRHYLFEQDDLLYVVDKATGGDDLYGYLFLISGAEATTAVFEGDLMYFVETVPSSGKYEPERPADDLAVTATLVSKTQRDDGVYTFVAHNDGKIDSGPNFGDGYASTFKEAVRKYSTFTADATYGNTSFSLEQGTAFLLFSLSFEDDVPASLSVSMTNNNGEDVVFTHEVAPDSNHEANFVAALPGGTVTLSNAKVNISDGGGFEQTRSLAGLTLQKNRYYNVVKTFIDLDYFTIQAPSGAIVTFPSKYQTDSYGLQYSRDGLTWTNVSDASIELAAGESIKLRGKGNKYQYSSDNTTLFTSSATCYIYGDIMSLFCTVSGDTYTKKTAFGSSNNNALDGTFKNMANLDIHPARPLLLSATTLSNSCYYQMFAGSGITRAPEFTNVEGGFAVNIPQSACKQMFQNCTALSTAPELPANGTIASEGYRGMFHGCTAMATPPTCLGVTPTIGSNSNFREMFQGCTSLLLSPELTASEVRENGCQNMFYDCSSLQEAPELPATIVAANAYNSMFKNCSSLLSGPSNLPAEDMYADCYRSMFQNCSLLETAPQIGVVNLAERCLYEMFSACHALRRAQATFAFSGDIPPSGCYRMFYECQNLLDAPEMPYITGTIENLGCKEMFSGCAEMRTAPSALNAGTVGPEGLYQMFYNCARLQDAPAVAATKVDARGCREMFRGCVRLQAPPALPATTLGAFAYYGMFYGCIRLDITSAYNLAAANIPESAYQQMFYGCAELTTPPASLPATTLGKQAYYQMFFGCSKLKAIPSFPSTAVTWNGDSVCYQMFQDCKAITTLTEPLFSGTSTLRKGCFQDMFAHCTALVNIPDNLLPATTLAVDCYRGMFQDTGLTRAPFLLVETLSWNDCYRYMFYGCKKLAYIKCLAKNPDTTYTQNFTGGGVASSGTFVKNAAMTTTWPTGANGIPSGWTVE